VYIISEANGHILRKGKHERTVSTERLKWILRFLVTIDHVSWNFCRRQELVISLWSRTLILSTNVRHHHQVSSSQYYRYISARASFYCLFWHQMLRHLMRPAAFEERYLAVDSSRQRTLVLDRSKEYR